MDQDTEIERPTECIVTPTREQYQEIADTVNSEADLYRGSFTDEELEALEIGSFTVDELITGELTRNYLVLELDDKVAGFASWYQKNDRVAWVSLLHVASDHRSLGVGTKLLSAVEKKAKELGMSAIALEAQRKADWAVNFYLKHGYEILGWEKLNTKPYTGTLDKPPVEATYVFGKVL